MVHSMGYPGVESIVSCHGRRGLSSRASMPSRQCHRMSSVVSDRGSRCGPRPLKWRVHATNHRGVPGSFEEYVLELQQDIIKTAEAMDESGKTFKKDSWERSPSSSGYGVTAVLEGGQVVEKAASNVSIIRGVLSETRAQSMSSRGRDCIDPRGGQEYSAAAMSLVFHSAHPAIPTLRADVRVFEVGGQRWFGGGCDLTPFYVHEDDFREFHGYWKSLCDEYDDSLYSQYKTWCDEYFYIPARKEHRGIGGLFFDDLDQESSSFENVEEFVRRVGYGILPSWMPIVERRRSMPISDRERDWQLVRRGRYLEFNLLYDRGVRFGLEGGRIESIMVSAPPLIAWKYNVVPEKGSPEEQLLELLSGQPKDWVQ
ncbi:hypothetical protein M9435_005229 [Picochlorum sp. BPE23]|nr:hypothetical protein M9435_005229 [Picochlorum sp. BPE23]